MVSGKVLKAFVVFLIAYLILSLALLLWGIIDPIAFWVVVLLAAGFAFFLLPKIQKSVEKKQGAEGQ